MSFERIKIRFDEVKLNTGFRLQLSGKYYQKVSEVEAITLIRDRKNHAKQRTLRFKYTPSTLVYIVVKLPESP